MRIPRLVTIMIIFILALFPAVVYAATDHSHGAGSAGTTPKQDVSSSQPGKSTTVTSGAGQNTTGTPGPGQRAVNSTGDGTPAADAQGAGQHMQQMMNMMSGQGAADGHGEKSAAEGHESSGGHGGEPKKNALEPFKNQIVAGFAGLNLLVIAAALIMKKKLGQGV